MILAPRFTLLFDFWVKSAGRSGFSSSDAGLIPIVRDNKVRKNAIVRTLRMNCLTINYSDLWEECWDKEFKQIKWAKADERLSNEGYENLTREWNEYVPMRTDYERRQCLIENDVLAAISLGLELEHLIIIYRAQFPIVKQYERDTWFDKKGRIVFTTSKGLLGVGFPRKSTQTIPIGWEDVKDMTSGTVERTIIDDTMPGGPIERTITYEAPFDRCNREKDYEVVWAEFERRFKE
jgi:hypothetical protein